MHRMNDAYLLSMSVTIKINNQIQNDLSKITDSCIFENNHDTQKTVIEITQQNEKIHESIKLICKIINFPDTDTTI